MKANPTLSVIALSIMAWFSAFARGEEKPAKMLDEFPQGQMAAVVTETVEEIVFAMRQPGKDGHWYANFS